MPGGSKKAADAALVVHLASGVSPAAAASERQAKKAKPN
jgi:hypothetical protein